MTNAVIVDAIRTPIGKFGGGLQEFSAAALAEQVIRKLIERSGIDPAAVDDVILGQVIQAGSGPNVARTALVRAGIPETVTATTVNMVCASGMKAVDVGRQAIALEEAGLVIAGGVESMSNAPFIASDVRWGHKLGSVKLQDSIMDEGLYCGLSGVGMGLTAEEIASRTGITRSEMDGFAVSSQTKALAAAASGRFTDEIVPLTTRKGEQVAHDEQPRETDLESLAKLKPAFKQEGSVTAGNSSTINDGAAALILASEIKAAALGLKPRARILATAATGIEPLVMGLGPVDAVTKLCSKLGCAPGDFDLIELNEAFAVQALAVLRALGLPEEKVNVNGGAIALGHPLGATGARIITTLLYEMEKRGARRGLASLCVGGGMGMAVAIETVAS